MAGRLLALAQGRSLQRYGHRTSLASMQRNTAAFRRGFAEEKEDLIATFATPREAFFNKEPVQMVQVPGIEGELGILGKHQPSITELKPGVVTVTTNKGDHHSWFVSGGFATVQEDSTCSINVLEAFKLEELDPELARSNYAKYQQQLASAKDEVEQANAVIGVQLFQAMVDALNEAGIK